MSHESSYNEGENMPNNNLAPQLNIVLDLYKHKAESIRPTEVVEADHRYMTDFFSRFIEERTQRATEIESADYDTIVSKAKAFFPTPVYHVLCIDGRVLPVLLDGSSAKINATARMPAGDPGDFLIAQNGSLFLKQGSDFANLIDQASERFPLTSQVLDSHVGCAARKIEEQVKGNDPNDEGLLEDVMHKREIAHAIQKYATSKGKDVITIQTSFNPASGYMYMGLETEEALALATKTGGFSKGVLDNLEQATKIINSEEIATEIAAVIEDMGSRGLPLDVDWVARYKETANNLYSVLTELKADDSIISSITKKVVEIYPNLKPKQNPTDAGLQESELNQRVALLLANAVSGYLHNRVPAPEDADLAHASERGQHNYADLSHPHYRYAVHLEEGVIVTEGGHGPYKTPVFSVFSQGNRIAANIRLATEIVRDNRRNGRIKDQGNFYGGDKKRFVAAPVPIVVKQIVRDLSPREWQELEELNLEGLPLTNWINEDEFTSYLEEVKPDISRRVFNSLVGLREKMAHIYSPRDTLSANVINGHKVVLPLIVDPNRRIRTIVPFVLQGYRE